jgi:hypothetical protein
VVTSRLWGYRFYVAGRSSYIPINVALARSARRPDAETSVAIFSAAAAARAAVARPVAVAVACGRLPDKIATCGVSGLRSAA